MYNINIWLLEQTYIDNSLCSRMEFTMRNFNDIFKRFEHIDACDVEWRAKNIAEEIIEKEGDIQLMLLTIAMRKLVEVSGRKYIENYRYDHISITTIISIFENTAAGNGSKTIKTTNTRSFGI